jgi:arylsulfatase A-like enzyme
MQMWLIPGHQAKVVGGVGRSIDFAPTVLELADIEHPLLDGESMVASFADGRFPHRERIAEGSGCVSLVRSDGYKFLSTGMVEDDATKGETFGPEHHRLAVFELASDPREYVNLIDTKQGQRVLDWAIDRHQALKS